MADYHTILIAIDLSEDSDLVAKRAAAVAAGSSAQLHLIHVIEPLSFAYGGDIPMDFSGIQDEIHQQAEQQLRRFGETHGIEESRQTIVLGRPEVEIHSRAEELNADLIRGRQPRPLRPRPADGFYRQRRAPRRELRCAGGACG